MFHCRVWLPDSIVVRCAATQHICLHSIQDTWLLMQNRAVLLELYKPRNGKTTRSPQRYPPLPALNDVPTLLVSSVWSCFGCWNSQVFLNPPSFQKSKTNKPSLPIPPIIHKLKQYETPHSKIFCQGGGWTELSLKAFEQLAANASPCKGALIVPWIRSTARVA